MLLVASRHLHWVYALNSSPPVIHQKYLLPLLIPVFELWRVQRLSRLCEVSFENIKSICLCQIHVLPFVKNNNAHWCLFYKASGIPAVRFRLLIVQMENMLYVQVKTFKYTFGSVKRSEVLWQGKNAWSIQDHTNTFNAEMFQWQLCGLVPWRVSHH